MIDKDTNNIVGYINFVLHGHLPFVYHPEHQDFLEEDWVFEAIVEVYIPLIDMLWELYELYNIKSKLNISLSPTLIYLLSNKKILEKLQNYINKRINFLQTSIKRDPIVKNQYLIKLFLFYLDFYKKIDFSLNKKYKRDLLGQFKKLNDLGIIHLFSTNLTHTFMPNYISYPWYLNLLVKNSKKEFLYFFNKNLESFWLPEAGYHPQIEEALKKSNIKRTILEAHGIIFGQPKPINVIYTPVYSSNKILYYPRDFESAKKVWSREIGYPANLVYRDFYKDIGFEFDIEDIKDLLHKNYDGGFDRSFTGIKLWNIKKDFYNIEEAKQQTYLDALDLFSNIKHRLIKIKDKIKFAKPILTMPFDMELFGHWWFEGIDFLKNLILIFSNQNEIQLTTLEEYQKIYSKHQIVNPIFSSWGEKGFAEVWSSNKVSSMLTTTYRVLEDYKYLVDMYKNNVIQINAYRKRLFVLLVKNILLLTSSDWPFMAYNNTSHYAYNRFNELFNRVETLLSLLLNKEEKKDILKEIEFLTDIFYNLEFEDLPLIND